MFLSKAGKPTSKPKLTTSLLGPPLIKVNIDLSIFKKKLSMLWKEYRLKSKSAQIRYLDSSEAWKIT